MKILIVAGGTGGHIFPAVALTEEIKSKNIGGVLFIISCRKQDRLILAGKNIDFQTIPVRPLQSKNIFSIPGFAIGLLIGSLRSIFILFRFRPDIVIGFGGYISGPIVLAASLFGIKTIIHEQNVYPGRANRILAPFVSKIALSFSESKPYFKTFESKTIVSGNPLRRGLKKALTQASVNNRFTVLVIGGSQGAHILNNLIPKAVGLIGDEKRRLLELIHISGEKERSDVISSYEKIGIKNRVFSFTEDMPRLYNECNFVIARSGAMTVSELLALAIPAILIPYPYAGKHQELNARVLESLGSAILLKESALTVEVLRDNILKLMDTGILNRMSGKIKNIPRDDASEILINAILTT